MMPWLARVLEENSSLAMDSAEDRAKLEAAIREQLERRCCVCYADLAGKTNRAHHASVEEKSVCKGSWL